MILGRRLQHRRGEPEQAKGTDGMQLFALDCIAYIVYRCWNGQSVCSYEWYVEAKADANESWIDVVIKQL